MVDLDTLREAFLRRLTVDSDTHDARRREFNQALFDADTGHQVFTSTDLSMVMDAFDAASRDARRR